MGTRAACWSISMYGSTPIPSAVSRSAGKKLSRSHLSDMPAASVQLIVVHAPGTAAQNVCTRPAGSIATRPEWANTTPEVPSVVNARPSSTTPMPTAAAALSPAPATTGVPSRRPVASAASREMRPATSHDSKSSGRSERSMSSASSTSSLQRRFATSSRFMPDASDTSAAYAPVSRQRR